MTTEAQPEHHPLLRMAELVEASGVSRDMIKYYLRASLLPRAHKPRSNLSLYAEQHLLLIRLILRFQAETKLSLPQIADVFQATDYDPHAIEIELLSGKFAAGHSDNIIPFEASTESSSSLAFPSEFLEELSSNGLLHTSTPLTEDEEKVAGLLWAAHNAGVPLGFFTAAREQLVALAELEVQSLIGIRRPDLDFDAVINNVTEVDRIINRWIISEKTGLARSMMERILDNSEQALLSVHDAIYFPSKVFRQRFDIERELADIVSVIAVPQKNLETLLLAARTCLVLTDFERSEACADAALEIAPDNDIAIAVKCLAYGMDKRLDKALLYARRLEASNSRHAMALEARLLTLLMQAAKLGGVSDTSDLLKEAAELFAEPALSPPLDQFDRLEATMLNARAATLFPDAINKGAEAIEELEALLEALEDEAGNSLDLPVRGSRAVYQVYTCFYLGQLHELGGENERARYFYERVIQLDPSSNFGEAAYLKLA